MQYEAKHKTVKQETAHMSMIFEALYGVKLRSNSAVITTSGV